MNRIALTLAAATAVAGMSLSSNAWAASNSPAAAQSSAMTSAQHAQTVDTVGVRSFLANITNDALTRSDLSKLVSNFTTADQARIQTTSTYGESYGSKLDGRIAQINKAWKTKYGHDFDARNTAYSTSFSSIRQGTAQSDPQLAQEVCGMAPSASSSSAMKNQQLAMVTLAASSKHSQLNVPLVQQSANEWRLNVPNSLDAATLRQNLLNHLTLIGQNSSNWPANENQACEAVTRSVLAAILQPQAHAAMTPAHTARSS